MERCSEERATLMSSQWCVYCKPQSWLYSCFVCPLHTCTHKYIHNSWVQSTVAGRHKKRTWVILSSASAWDGSLINASALQLFIISATSNLQLHMIGLMYDALVNSEARGKNVLLLVRGNLYPCQMHFPPSFVHLKELSL